MKNDEEVDFLISNEQFEKDIQKIEQNSQTRLLAYSRIIKYCREILELYRSGLRTWSFNSVSEEILFFKEHKQTPLTYLIFYLELRSLELQPSISEKSKRKLLHKKLKKIRKFLKNNSEFQKYVELNQTFLDEFYYTRGLLNKVEVQDYPIYWDSEFSTSHDLLLARLRAYQKLSSFIQRQLRSLELPTKDNTKKGDFHWTSSKVALVELIYALQSSGAINQGSADIKTIASALEEFFNINLDNLYKNFSEIKARKGRRTKFMDELTQRLEQKLVSDEGL